MKMKEKDVSKIYLNNFIVPAQDIELITVSKIKFKAIGGFDLNFINYDELKKHTCFEIISNLLLYEKLILDIKKLILVIQLFGFEFTNTLLSNNYIEVVDFNGFEILLQDKGEYFCVLPVRNLNHKNQKDINWLEERLNTNTKLNETEKKLILLNTERNIIDINIDKIKPIVLEELKYDLNNSNLTNKNIFIELSKIKDINPYTVLRLAYINKTLITSKELNCNNISIDGFAKEVLKSKFSPILNQFNLINTENLFQDLSEIKKLPNLSDLFLKGILTLDDIINLRENFNGNKFRKWLISNEYNKDEIINGLINSNKTLSKKVLEHIRWFIPNAVGIVNTGLGITLSSFDNYILKSFVDWNPNLYLDNALKEQINKKIEDYDKNKRIEEIKKRFPDIGRNDKCPCKSNKKFKKCCGQ